MLLVMLLLMLLSPNRAKGCRGLPRVAEGCLIRAEGCLIRAEGCRGLPDPSRRLPRAAEGCLIRAEGCRGLPRVAEGLLVLVLVLVSLSRRAVRNISDSTVHMEPSSTLTFKVLILPHEPEVSSQNQAKTNQRDTRAKPQHPQQRRPEQDTVKKHAKTMQKKSCHAKTKQMSHHAKSCHAKPCKNSAKQARSPERVCKRLR